MKRKYEAPMIEQINVDSLLLDLGIRLPNLIGDKDVLGSRPKQIFIVAYTALIEISLYKDAHKIKLDINPQIKIDLGVQTSCNEEVILIVKISAKIEGVSYEIAKQLLEQACQACPYTEIIKSKGEVILEVI